jgi:hypothetical protein
MGLPRNPNRESRDTHSEQTGCKNMEPGDTVEEESTGSEDLVANENDQVAPGGDLPMQSSEISTSTNENLSESRQWLAPVHVNSVLMMLVVGTGVAMTIINSEKFLNHLNHSLLQPNEHTFRTAAGATLQVLGHAVCSNFGIGTC